LGKGIPEIFRQVRWSDVVHIHDSLYMANILAFFASRWYGKPLMVTQHVALVPYTAGYKYLMQRLAYGTLGKLVLENAAAIIFINQRVEEWFKRRMKFRGKTAFIPNGVDGSLFFPPAPAERRSLRNQLGFSRKDMVCLFVGRFTQKKGLHLVREIAGARPNIRWLLIGSGELKPCGWNLPNVQVLPPCPQAELRRYYVAADLLVLPSVGEGFPLVVQEALSCGLPAAVSPEIADYSDAPLLKISVSDLPALLEKLDVFFEDKHRLATLQRSSRQYARRWDWEVVAQKYEALYFEPDSLSRDA